MLFHRRASSGWRPSIAAGADRTARHTHTRASVRAGGIRAGRGVAQRRDVEARAAPWKRGPHFSALWISARRAGGRAERQTARGRQRTAAFGARRRAEAEAGSHLGLLVVQLRGRALDLLVQAQVVLRARTGVRSSGGGGIRQQPNRAQQERHDDERRRAHLLDHLPRAALGMVGRQREGDAVRLAGHARAHHLWPRRARRRAGQATPPSTKAASNSTTSTCRARAWGARLRRRAGQAPRVLTAAPTAACRSTAPGAGAGARCTVAFRSSLER